MEIHTFVLQQYHLCAVKLEFQKFLMICKRLRSTNQIERFSAFFCLLLLCFTHFIFDRKYNIMKEKKKKGDHYIHAKCSKQLTGMWNPSLLNMF